MSYELDFVSDSIKEGKNHVWWGWKGWLNYDEEIKLNRHRRSINKITLELCHSWYEIIKRKITKNFPHQLHLITNFYQAYTTAFEVVFHLHTNNNSYMTFLFFSYLYSDRSYYKTLLFNLTLDNSFLHHDSLCLSFYNKHKNFLKLKFPLCSTSLQNAFSLIHVNVCIKFCKGTPMWIICSSYAVVVVVEMKSNSCVYNIGTS